MFWGCVASKFVGALVPTPEATDTRKYIEILEKYLRPSVSWYFGDDTATFQHDNSLWHVSRLIRKYLEENNIFTMEWSAYSQDLNIIVSTRLSVKRKKHSDAVEIKGKEDIIERFRSACNETTQLEIEKLYASLPSHSEDIIFKKGHLFRYQ